MTLQKLAATAIRNAIRLNGMDRDRAYTDPRIAAWLVWSMRGTQDARMNRKTFNRARRVLQRAGLIRV